MSDALVRGLGTATFAASEDVSHPSLLHLLKKVDRSSTCLADAIGAVEAFLRVADLHRDAIGIGANQLVGGVLVGLAMVFDEQRKLFADRMIGLR